VMYIVVVGLIRVYLVENESKVVRYIEIGVCVRGLIVRNSFLGGAPTLWLLIHHFLRDVEHNSVIFPCMCSRKEH